MQTTNEGNIAVLIDADNVSHRVIAGVMAEVTRYGNASVRRIYGDFTSPLMIGWRERLLEYSIIPVQQFAYTTGKNATDGAMIIDAMDLLYTNRFSAFCLVSSDSDFTRLAARIREQGLPVYGFGNRKTTNGALIAACNEFVYFDALSMPTEKADTSTLELAEQHSAPRTHGSITTLSSAADSMMTDTPTSKLNQDTASIPTGPAAHTRAADASQRLPPNLFNSRAPTTTGPVRRINDWTKSNIRFAIREGSRNGVEANLAEVGAILKRVSPDLTHRNYGYERLKEFLEASGIVELRMQDRQWGAPIAYVRLKD